MKQVKEQLLSWIISAALLVMPFAVIAQGTRIELPKNRYAVADDIKLGQQAAAQVEQQLPTLPENSEIDNYVERVGRRLVAAIPREYQHRGFNYQFDVVNAREINAFALPGGPMYVNRGMIEAARNEGEMAGVMAHEISHVALRHGTAQATKAQSGKVQLGAIGGAILGAIIGGNVGGIISQGTQLGLSAYLLKFSREYETQADILGAQIMARAGYDPRDLANMFRTIERQSGGSGGPEWLSSHPNPGNRYERINQEAQLLGRTRANANGNNREFSDIQAQLQRQSSAPSMEEIARNQQRSTNRYPNDSRIEQRVDYPSSRYRTYTGSNLFRIHIPENWRDFSEQNSVTFVPPGAYGEYQGQSVFTHGAIVGVTAAGSRNLRQASDQYLNALLQTNSYLTPQRNYRNGSIDGRKALMMVMTGRSPVTGRAEAVTVYTTLLNNDVLFYIINVVPQDQYQSYDRVFQTMLRSVQIFS
jgi:beta-barrel assembly-enhancing protease